MIRKLFVPHKHNDYRPHLFRMAGLSLCLAVAAFLFAATSLQKLFLGRTSILASAVVGTMTDLTNEERASLYLPSLTVSPLLTKAAQEKADDMATKGYFAHVSPDGTTPWHWINDVGYDYIFAGENLAVDFDDSAAVVNAWMNSPLHRANITDSRFKEIGIATARGHLNGRPTTFIVQMFGSPIRSNSAATIDAVFFSKLLTSPSTVIMTVLMILAGLVILSLALIIVIGINKKNGKEVAFALIALIVIGILIALFSNSSFSNVTIV